MVTKTILERHGFVVTDLDDGKVMVRQSTPAGEDWGFELDSLSEFDKFVDNFDAEDEFRALYESKISGLPSAQDLLDDQEWKQKVLNDVCYESRASKQKEA